MQLTLKHYDDIIEEFKVWFNRKGLQWYIHNHTSRKPYKKVWSLFYSERTGKPGMNHYKSYRYQIMSVMAIQLCNWQYTNLAVINAKKKRKKESK